MLHTWLAFPGEKPKKGVARNQNLSTAGMSPSHKEPLGCDPASYRARIHSREFGSLGAGQVERKRCNSDGHIGVNALAGIGFVKHNNSQEIGRVGRTT